MYAWMATKAKINRRRRDDGGHVRVPAAQAVQALGQQRGGLPAPLCRRHARRVESLDGCHGAPSCSSNQQAVSQVDPADVSRRSVVCATRVAQAAEPWLLKQMVVVLLLACVVIGIRLIVLRSPSALQAEIRRRQTPTAKQSASMHASLSGHYRAKPREVREGLFRIALEAPDASCRAIADRFNRDYADQGWSVGKTYVAEFLRDSKQWRAAPKRHAHSIDSACAVNRVWTIDLTEHRIDPQEPQPLLGILDHGSRRMLMFHALRVRSSIAILRLLLDAIEHYGRPKAIRTDNEAIFTSWVFAFALQWLVSATRGRCRTARG